ncbi:YkvA family protein [Streptomyces zingiberis]|uniref:DUF1232 domain-containing protein n=1 Tax=Streptomyces zingiberis TaxID=2053010 RepID=A0ABX1BUF1_9ACTN|nr:YkvA family protein [Streptomyces zingiberis]NJP99376.1 DUF1232 domain-containing protein [Streptomyces zingiberis]
MDTETIVLITLAVVVVATFAAVVVLALRLVRTYRTLRSEGTTRREKLLFWGAILYTVSPVDLLPDPIYVDDIGLLMAALHQLGKAAGNRRGALPGSGADLPGVESRPPHDTAARR